MGPRLRRNEHRGISKMIINRQNQIELKLPAVRLHARRISKLLDLGAREFNVAFVDDEEMARLNSSYRGKNRTTDVLSFQWENGPDESGEFRTFLGDIIISVPEASRNALREGHALEQEIRWLILHGVLHLLGYDHEQDNGEMNTLELSLREKLEARSSSRRVRRLEPVLRG